MITRKRRNRPIYASPGTVSSGTLNPQDLFESFLYDVKHLHLTRAERNEVRKIEANVVPHGASEETLEERLSEDIEALTSILESHALPYFYFGATEGDGAEFGFWLGDMEDFDGLRVSDTSEVPKGYSGEVLHVSDHGNPTLYTVTRGRLREVWSIV